MDSNNIKITPKWKKTKEEIWSERFSMLSDLPKAIHFYQQKWFAFTAAAIIFVMILLPTTAYLYTTNVIVPRGKHLTVLLPDGSKVQLNADTHLSYKPYWWSISREVELHGEGYFEVNKGSRFNVHTTKGSVTVLGTSFNVLARENNFAVLCLTGKVKVVSGPNSATLIPDMQTVLHNKKLITTVLENASQSIGWTEGRFYFTATPLRDVIKEIERQYNISIEAPDQLNYLYTGSFSRNKAPQEVLQIIGTPFGLKLTVK